jgi:RNA polymerase sigma factor (TIGR02999 family)
MSDEQTRNITMVLKAWSDGDNNAADRLMPLVYDGLRKIAAQYLRKERGDHTFQPTALVHEAYLKLIDVSDANWQDRAHFFAAASTMMRHILVDHARARLTDKRGGDFQKIELDEAISFSDKKGEKNLDILALDEALNQLAEFDEQQSRIVELRFFGGLTVEETAEVLKISPATVKREWALAKAWLYSRMKDEG